MAENISPDQAARNYAKTESGENVLLSAAAGSGKTYTLVERIYHQTVEKRSTSIDRLLVVTFTRAAAAELKNRIAEKYTAMIVENADTNPEISERAKEQKLLLPRAMIGTIDQLCADIVRKHFTAIGIEPNFNTDDNVVRIIFEETEEEVLDEYYLDKGSEKYAVVREMNDILCEVANDDDLRGMLYKVVENAKENVDPVAWLRETAENYATPEKWFDKLREACENIVCAGLEHLRESKKLFGELHADIQDQDKYEKIFAEDEKLFNDLLAKIKKHDGIFEITANDFQWENFPSAKKNDPADKRAHDILKKECDRYRTKTNSFVLKKLNEYLFIDDYKETYVDADSKKKDFEKSVGAMKKYAGIISEIAEKIYVRACEKCVEKSTFDFNRIEHFALEILSDGNVRKSYRDSIDEIIVDEYQDTNAIQEEILIRLSGMPERNNMMMVGDVKQAIYGFRKATPKFFLKKYDAFNSDPAAGTVRILCRNFRSRGEVLGGVNSIFEKVMTEKTAGIDYKDGHGLNYGAVQSYGEFEENEKSQNKCEYIVTAEKDQSITVAKRILKLFNDGFRVRGRTLGFGDICIIASKNKQLDVMRDGLHRLGFPVSSGGEKNLFEQREIVDLMDYLRIIDNPRHDVPLCSVLKSRFYRFTDNELALIRAMGGRYGSYYECVTNVANGSFKADFDSDCKDKMLEKMKTFSKDLGELRDFARVANVSELCWLAANAQGYYKSISDSAKDNVHRLIDVAAMFDNGANGGLYAFLRHVDALAEIYKDKPTYFAAPTGEGGDAISFMTVHKSKGLEAPVVFVVNAETTPPKTGSYYIDDTLGVGFKYINRSEGEIAKSVPLQILAENSQLEEKRESQRRLYVALTRAREKLIVVESVNKEEMIHEVVDPCHEPLATDLSILMSSSFADLIKLGLFTDEARKYWTVYANDKVITEQDVIEGTKSLVKTSEAYAENVTEFEGEDCTVAREFEKIVEMATIGDNRFPSKLSVSALKKLSSEDDPESGTGANAVVVRDFGKDEKKSGAFFGTIIHKCLELLIKDRKQWPDEPEEYVKACVENWKKRGIFSDDEAKLIEADMLVSFMNSERGREVKRAENVRCEVPFTAILNVSDYVKTDDKTENNLAIQGVIDLYYKNEKGIIIIDFKTDRTENPETYEFTDCYRTQLECYRDALEKISGEKVAECCIYFLRSRKELLV